ncbi:MAG: hypothetical protein ACTHN4_11175 [Sphingomicrobium sp.]
MDFLKRANKTKVDPQLMEDIFEAIDKLPPGDRDFEGTSILIVRHVAELGLPEKRRMDLSMALNFRFMAFARLIQDGGGRGWTWPGKEEGCTIVDAELIRTAAEEPMIEVNEQVAFDPASFQRRLLALAEPHGQA